MGGDEFQNKPKSRPARNSVSMAEINQNMQLVLSQQTHEVIEDMHREDSDYLETFHKSDMGTKELSRRSILPIDGIYGKHILTKEALEQRQLMKGLNLDTQRILLGAAWTDKES